jgi:hypothetical protein
MKQVFMNAYESGDLSKTMYDDAMGDAMTHEQDLHNDLHVAKKERKTVIDDMQEVSKNDLAEAFLGAVSSKVMVATGQQKKSYFPQEEFCKGVCNYYDAKRSLEDDFSQEVKQKWCHVLGWQNAEDVRCAHIVPKSLESHELARFFGAEQTTLMEPRNGK